MSNNQSHFNFISLDHGVPFDDYSRFIMRFVDHFSLVLHSGNIGCKNVVGGFNDSDMIKLILYAYSDDITSSIRIEDFARYHQLYRMVSNDIQPSERTIRRFIEHRGYLFKFCLGLSLLFAQELGMTDFKHLSIDGTIKKANNNKFNVLDENTIDKLINHYLGSELDEDELKKKSYPAYKFLKRTDLSINYKIELLNEMKTQINLSGQNTVPVNDIEARWMLNKKGNKEPSYNIQTAVDTKSKLICAVKVSQSPTNHYELPQIVEQAIENVQTEPEYISADTGYHTQVSFDFLKNKNFKGLIPDRRQTRENTQRLSKKPFHKDNFKYNHEEDTFICPNKQKLPFKYQYLEPTNYKQEKIKIKRIYMNYNACKKCKDKNECCKGKFRQITEYMDEYALNMREFMKTQNGQELFKQRFSTVEAPFGTLIFNFGMNKLMTKGLQHTEEILTIFSTTYNLKRIYNTIKKEINQTNNINLFKEKMEILLNLDLKITEMS